MPPKGAFTLTMTNMEHANLVLQALTHGINYKFSFEEKDLNTASYYADLLDKNIEDRKVRERHHKMRHVLSTAKTLDEARAMLDAPARPPLTDDEQRAESDRMQAETIQLMISRMSPEERANLQNTGESDAEVHD